jgi:hypothetical protein
MRQVIMLARLKTSIKGTNLPNDWREGFSLLLHDGYGKECDQQNRVFDVYGQIYSEEILIVVSCLSRTDASIAPIALFLSCDPEQMNNEQKVNEVQKNYIELAGLFFDQIFAISDWSEFEPSWQEVTHNNRTYYFKLSRENINLTLEANRLLGEEFQDVVLEDLEVESDD